MLIFSRSRVFCMALVQVGGAVKNVIAIAAGMCEGLGLGTNAMAALVTRGCNEMQRLALSLGAMPTTLTGNVECCIQSDQVVTVWHRFVWLNPSFA